MIDHVANSSQSTVDQPPVRTTGVAIKWWEEFFRDVDRRERQSIERWFAPDAEMQFGNWPVVSGKDNVVRVLNQFLSRLESITHIPGVALAVGDQVFSDAIVQYGLPGGFEVTIPGGTLFKRSSSGIHRLKVFIDVSSVLSRLDQAASSENR